MWALKYATGVVSSISGRPGKPSWVSPNVKTRSQRVTCSGVASRLAGVLYAGVCIPAYFRRLFRIAVSKASAHGREMVAQGARSA